MTKLTASPIAVTEIPTPAPIPLTGILQFAMGNVDPSFITPTNPRGYNNGSIPGVRQINELIGAEAYFNWLITKIPPAQLTTTGVAIMVPGGELRTIVQKLAVDYASSLELTQPGWGLLAARLTAHGIPFGIACRPAENYNPDPAAKNIADVSDPIQDLWLQSQLTRTMALFPIDAKIILYCDSVNGGANFAKSLAVLKRMKQILAQLARPNVLLLPECSEATADQIAQFLTITGGVYSEITSLAGDTLWISAADRIALQKQFPTAQWIGKANGNFQITPQQLRALNIIPMVEDYISGL